MRRSRRRLLAALGALSVLLAAAAVAEAVRAPPAAPARARTGRAAPGADGIQTAELVLEAGEYAPNVVRARAGAPLRLSVAVHDRHSCASRLLVPDLGLDLALVPGGVAEALLPAAPPGAYLFTCAERMVKGVLVLE